MENYLIHYGRSKKDGAPGIGTGNWKRRGHFANDTAEALKEIDKVRATDPDKYIKVKNKIFKKENVIRKGTKLERVSLKTIEDKAASLYTSLHGDLKASKYYNHDWATALTYIANDPKTKVYRNTYKVNTDIIAPGEKERARIIEIMVREDRKIAEEYGKTYVNSRLKDLVWGMSRKDGNSIDKFSIYTLSNADVKDLVIKEYGKKYIEEYIKSNKEDADWCLENGGSPLVNTFMYTIPKSPTLMKKLQNAMMKEGYNAIVDTNSEYNSDAPFIIFDQNYIEQIGSKQIRGT